MNWRTLAWLGSAGIVVTASSAGCKNKDEGATAAPAVVEAAAPEPLPADVASTQSIRFHLPTRPGGPRRRFLPGMVVSRVDDAGVKRLDTTPPADCPCPPCPPPAPLPTGPSVADMTWDARAYATVPYAPKCPDGAIGHGAHAFLRPVPPGRYRVSFLVTVCGSAPDAGRAGAAAALDPNAECHEMSTRPAEAELDLPASGDMDISVP